MTTNKGGRTLDIQDKSVLLTGGSGFLGQHLRDRFSEMGVDVTLFSYSSSTVDLHPEESLLEGDITDKDSLPSEGFDLIIHLAAQTSVDYAIENPRRTWDVNASGTLNILEKARGMDIERFFYASTSSVYGAPQYLPIDEAHPSRPLEPYGASKSAAEQLTNTYFHSYDTPVVIGRFFNIFGPGQSSYNVIPTIIEQAKQNAEIELGNLSPSRDFIYVSDVVDALIVLLEKGDNGEIYNVGRGDDITIGEIAELIKEAVGRDIPVKSLSERQRGKSVEIPRQISEISKIKQIGWRPDHDVKSGIEKTVESQGE